MLTIFGEGRPSTADREQRPQYVFHLDLRTKTVTSEKDTLTYATEGWKEEDPVLCPRVFCYVLLSTSQLLCH